MAPAFSFVALGQVFQMDGIHRFVFIAILVLLQHYFQVIFVIKSGETIVIKMGKASFFQLRFRHLAGCSGGSALLNALSAASTTLGLNWLPLQSFNSARDCSTLFFRPVYTGGGHGVKGIGYRDDAGQQRNVWPLKPIGISPTVITFMMMKNDSRQVLVHLAL